MNTKMAQAHEIRRYSGVAIGLHWLIAVAILANLAIGLYMNAAMQQHPGRPTPLIAQLFSVHIIIGIAVLLLTMIRLAWRLTHRPPPLPAMNAPMTFLARASHVLLYTASFLIPLTGLIVIGVGRHILPAGWFPDLGHSPDRAAVFTPQAPMHQLRVVSMFIDTHEVLAIATIALLFLHVGAAILHHGWFRDETLHRMLPTIPARELRGSDG